MSDHDVKALVEELRLVGDLEDVADALEAEHERAEEWRNALLDLEQHAERMAEVVEAARHKRLIEKQGFLLRLKLPAVNRRLDKALARYVEGEGE